ncbi:MAG: GHKL domain-containing protein [Erysipelotrichaceae bacterium]|nr:GHKL domain-containing protein [Erysipelotrichaceae bacterium]
MLILSIITLILGVISTIYMNEMVIWILCINMVLQFIYFTYHHKISWVSLLLQICVLLVLSTLENEFVLLLYFVSIRYHDDTLLDTYETSNTRYQNKLLKNQVDEVQNIYMTMRGWRHDYHNHLQSLKAKLTKNQIDESIEYLNELEKDLDDIHQIVETGNINIDAILNSKLSLAMTHDIDVNVKVSIPTNLPINNIDCCVLLGNLIDNAIEACENVDGDKYIRLYIGLYKKQLYISITNATNEIVRKFDEEYITTKRGNHGHGLKRINKVVEKYNGYINRKNEPGVFVTEIMLPMNQTCTK